MANIDSDYLERQSKIIEVYRILIAYFVTVSAQKELVKREKEKQ